MNVVFRAFKTVKVQVALILYIQGLHKLYQWSWVSQRIWRELGAQLSSKWRTRGILTNLCFKIHFFSLIFK